MKKKTTTTKWFKYSKNISRTYLAKSLSSSLIVTYWCGITDETIDCECLILLSLMLQSRGRGDPSRDLSALHPAAVLPGDVHNGDAQVDVPAGGAAATQKKYSYSSEHTV